METRSGTRGGQRQPGGLTRLRPLPCPKAGVCCRWPDPKRWAFSGTSLSWLSGGELVARHLNLALRAEGLNSSRGWVAIMQQMSRTTRAIQQAHEARGELAAAQRLFASVPVLEQTTASLPASAAGTTGEAQRYGALHGHSVRTPTGRLPNKRTRTNRRREPPNETADRAGIRTTDVRGVLTSAGPSRSGPS